MNHAWTGGQYSLFRVLFGSYLLVHFAQLLPWATELFSNAGVLPSGSLSPFLHLFPNILALWDGPLFVTALLVAACVLSLLLAIGKADRIAAVLLWYLLACLFGRNPLILNPGLPYVGLLLLVHAALPPAPYGSWAARGRVDPAGSWRMTPSLFAVLWVLMALGYSYSGYTKLVSPSWQDGTALQRILENPLARPGMLGGLLLSLPPVLLKIATFGALLLELLFAPLALLRRVRPWIWTGMLALHGCLILLIDFADLSLGMVMLHLCTFDPRWVRPKTASKPEILFFDGTCGMCHRFTRLVLAEDHNPHPLRIAPLGGDLFQEVVPEADRASLPDSLILATADGTLIFRSNAALHILRHLGGAWRVLAAVLSCFPRPLRDLVYDGVARIRYRLFARPAETCPLLPARLRNRFEA